MPPHPDTLFYKEPTSINYYDVGAVKDFDIKPTVYRIQSWARHRGKMYVMGWDITLLCPTQSSRNLETTRTGH